MSHIVQKVVQQQHRTFSHDVHCHLHEFIEVFRRCIRYRKENITFILFGRFGENCAERPAIRVQEKGKIYLSNSSIFLKHFDFGMVRWRQYCSLLNYSSLDQTCSL